MFNTLQPGGSKKASRISPFNPLAQFDASQGAGYMTQNSMQNQKSDTMVLSFSNLNISNFNNINNYIENGLKMDRNGQNFARNRHNLTSSI
jgi:tRNA-binding EMAP/Myf-like protein